MTVPAFQRWTHAVLSGVICCFLASCAEAPAQPEAANLIDDGVTMRFDYRFERSYILTEAGSAIFLLKGMPRNEVWRWEPSEKRVVRFRVPAAEGIVEGQIAYSPNGALIAAVVQRWSGRYPYRGLDPQELLIFEASAKLRHRFAGFRRYGSPVFSPDGKKVYYWRDYEIWAERPQGEGVPRSAAIFEYDLESGLERSLLTATQAVILGARPHSNCRDLPPQVRPVVFLFPTGQRFFVAMSSGEEVLLLPGGMINLDQYHCSESGLLTIPSGFKHPLFHRYDVYLSFPTHSGATLDEDFVERAARPFPGESIRTVRFVADGSPVWWTPEGALVARGRELSSPQMLRDAQLSWYQVNLELTQVVGLAPSQNGGLPIPELYDVRSRSLTTLGSVDASDWPLVDVR